MYVVGLDIGYSNLKVVHGDSAARAPVTVILPAGAAPTKKLGTQLNGRRSAAISVLVGEEEWVAGVSQDRLINVHRELHHDYVSTPAYRALLHAALLHVGREHVDHLITGLPLEHFFDPKHKARVQDQLIGVHQVSRDVKVTVARVSVVPQPAGTAIGALRLKEIQPTMKRGRVAVIDPGFFSVDWMTLHQMEVVNAMSGTSTDAISRLLERVRELIHERTGAAPRIEVIEAALRGGDKQILHCGDELQLGPFVATATQELS